MFQFTQLIHIAAPHVSAETEKKVNNYLIKSVASNMLQAGCHNQFVTNLSQFVN
jgi:hypothetical protein